MINCIRLRRYQWDFEAIQEVIGDGRYLFIWWSLQILFVLTRIT
jgi:hypothetical protein